MAQPLQANPPLIQASKIRLDTCTEVVDGWRIFSRFCESAGHEHLPVVMVHGLAMSSRYMVPVARELSVDFSVYAPDMPGFGESQKTEKALSLPALAQVLRAWMDSAGIGRAVLLGNSLGCEIIANFVLQSPGRTAGAVLIGPTMDPRLRSLISAFGHGVLNMLYEPVSFYPVLVHDYFTYGARRTFQSLEESFHDPIEPKLARLDLPVLVVRGQHDKLCSAATAEARQKNVVNGATIEQAKESFPNSPLAGQSYLGQNTFCGFT